MPRLFDQFAGARQAAGLDAERLVVVPHLQRNLLLGVGQLRFAGFAAGQGVADLVGAFEAFEQRDVQLQADAAVAFAGIAVEGHRLVAMAACQVGAQRQARPAGGAAFLHRGGGGFQPRLGGEQRRMLAAGFGEHLVDGLDEAGVGLRLQLAGEAQRGIRRQAHAQGDDAEGVAQGAFIADLGEARLGQRGLCLQAIGKGGGAGPVLGVGGFQVLRRQLRDLPRGGQAALGGEGVVVGLGGEGEGVLQGRVLAGVGRQQQLLGVAQGGAAAAEVEQHPAQLEAGAAPVAMAVAGEVGGIAIIHVAVAATGVETAVQARQVGGLADPDLGRLGLGIGPGEAGLRVVAEDPLDGFLPPRQGKPLPPRS